MKKECKWILFLLVLLAFTTFNISAAIAADSQSPKSVAKKFTQAYFMMDKSMGDYLSKEARYNENEMDMVDLYLDIKAVDAMNLGYKISYFKMQPIQTKVTILEQGESSATLKLDVETIRSINPLFRAIGYVFCLLEEHKKSDIITLVKEDGLWKIGPGAFDLPVPI